MQKTKSRTDLLLHIVSPVEGKGLGRTYRARAEKCEKCGQDISAPLKESHYIELGLLVVDPETGEAVNDVLVEVRTTDPRQNRSIIGTGNITKFNAEGLVPGAQGERVLNYYPCHYEFRTKGRHKIEFIVNGQRVKTEMDVSEDD